MAGETLAEFSRMKAVYRAREENTQKGEALHINECFVLKYLLETCNSSSGTILQFGKGSGLEFEAIGQSLRSGFRILLIDQKVEAEKSRNNKKKRGRNEIGNRGQGLITPLSPLDAFSYLVLEIGMIQMLFIRSYDFVEYYFKRYEQLLIQNGYVALFLDADTMPLTGLLNYLDSNERYQKFYRTERLAIYRLIDPVVAERLVDYKQYMCQKLDAVRIRVDADAPNVPVVGLGVLTYNHALYIAQCLDGMFSQTGNFKKKVVIVDDCSTDGTSRVVDDYLRSHTELIGNVEVVLIHNKENLGALRAIGILLHELMIGTDYFTYIEGDDYWCSPQRTQTHLNILQENPQIAFCVNAFKLYLQNQNRMSSGNRFSKLPYRYNNTYDLISNYIGNAGCYFYRSSLLHTENFERIKRMEIEWQLVLLLSMQGDCYFLDEELNVYRKHEGGTWSELRDEEKDLLKLKHLANIDQELGLLFDYAFVNKCAEMMRGCFLAYRSRYNLVIADQLMISPQNSELRAITQFLLENTEFSMLYLDIYNMQFQMKNKALEMLHSIRKAYPTLSTKICAMDGWGGLSAKVLLAFDVRTAYMTLAICERYKIPLVCILAGNESVNHEHLRRLLSSEMLFGLVVEDTIPDMEAVKQSRLDAAAILTVEKESFNTWEAGEKILRFLQGLTKKIDYDKLKDDKLLNESGYAAKHDLHDQFPVWNIDLGYDPNHGKLYNGCKRIYLRYCPKRIKPYVKKIWRVFYRKND